MEKSFLLGLGTGRCGTKSLSAILSSQPESLVTHEDHPYLPWKSLHPQKFIQGRLEKWQASRKQQLIGDVAFFYLPYLESAFQLSPSLKAICLRRDQAQTVASFMKCDEMLHPQPINNFTQQVGTAFIRHPLFLHSFPKYDLVDKHAALQQYWLDYYAKIEELKTQYPDRLMIVETEKLSERLVQEELLTFAGIPLHQQVINTEIKNNQLPEVLDLDQRFPLRNKVAIIYSGINMLQEQNTTACHAWRESAHKLGVITTALPEGPFDFQLNRVMTKLNLGGVKTIIVLAPGILPHPEVLLRHSESCTTVKVISHTIPQKSAHQQNLNNPRYLGMIINKQALDLMQERLMLPLCFQQREYLIPYFQSGAKYLHDGFAYLHSFDAFQYQLKQSQIYIQHQLLDEHVKLPD